MGQAHPRGIAPSPPRPVPSQPDPPTSTAIPPRSPPLSAPAMRQSDTSETWTRIDYGPPPPRSAPILHAATSSAPPPPIPKKSLARKLSAKRRKQPTPPRDNDPPPPSTSTKALRTLGQELRAFEALVQEKEARVGIVTPSPPAGLGSSGKTIKAATFASYRAKRASISSVIAFPPPPPSGSSAQDGSGDSSPIPFPMAQHLIRPSTTLRRSASSASSTHSTRTRRAEREWRARVAAMAHLHDMGRSPSKPPRGGPVPPRRAKRGAAAGGGGGGAGGGRGVRGAATSVGAANEEEDESGMSENVVTPQHASLHHLAVPADDPPLQNTIASRRQATTSFVSSKSFETFCFHAHNQAEETPTPGVSEEQGERDRKLSVPQSVSSYLISRPSSLAISTLLDRPHSPSPSSSPSPMHTTTPTKVRSRPSLAELPPPESPHTPPASPSTPHKESLPAFGSFRDSPSAVGPPMSPPCTPRPSIDAAGEYATDARRRHSTPERSDTDRPRAQRPASSPSPVKQRQSQEKEDEEEEPLSPTTAYILTAPLDKLWVPYTPVRADFEVPERRPHPYAAAGPERPISEWTPSFATVPRKVVNSERGRQLKAEVLGSGWSRSYERTRGRVDLTPGMESGVRPPKSGMPMMELEKWLSQSAGAVAGGEA